MTIVANWNRLLGMAILLTVLAGCGPSHPATYPVKGRITFEGKSMAGGGSIAFIPQGPGASHESGGEIKNDGTYELMTFAPGDGAVEGNFRVVITQVVYQEPQNVGDGEGKASAPEVVVAEAERIPAIYSDFTGSPLTATVEAKAVNELDFDLKRQ